MDATRAFPDCDKWDKHPVMVLEIFLSQDSLVSINIKHVLFPMWSKGIYLCYADPQYYTEQNAWLCFNAMLCSFCQPDIWGCMQYIQPEI